LVSLTKRRFRWSCQLSC